METPQELEYRKQFKTALKAWRVLNQFRRYGKTDLFCPDPHIKAIIRRVLSKRGYRVIISVNYIHL